MVNWKSLKRNIYLTVGSLIILGFTAWLGLNIYQPPGKADEIYEQALSSYNGKDYSNAYYQFSKIIFLSNLKP